MRTPVKPLSFLLSLVFISALSFPVGASAQLIATSQYKFSAAPLPPPGALNKLNPIDESLQPSNAILRWTRSSGTMVNYYYCLVQTDVEPVGDTCSTSWTSAGISTTVSPPGLVSGTYYWQVMATNPSGASYADSHTWWSFNVTADAPLSFHKISPVSGSGDNPGNTSLSWETTTPATEYVYCLDTVNNSACDTEWHSTSMNHSVTLHDLHASTTYYWQVKAKNGVYFIETLADGGQWWNFVTRAPTSLIVMNNHDSNAGSLRQAITDAAWGDTILFNDNFDIHLASTLVITKDLVINGFPYHIIINGDTNSDTNPDIRQFRILDDTVVTLSNLSIVDGNSTDPGGPDDGGSITNQGNLTVTGVTFSGNDASMRGGAIGNNDLGTVLIEASTFSDNTALNDGGAIYNDGVMTVQRSTFTSNRVTDSTSSMGGAIFNYGTLSVDSSTFSGNISANDGGAISSNIFDLDHVFSVVNSTFYGNSAKVGGAFFFLNNLTESSILNSTIVSNSSSMYGSGIYTYESDVTLASSIVANNYGDNCRGAVNDGGGNLDWDSSFTWACPGFQANPYLGELANNGGPVLTIAPPVGSPAIDGVPADALCADKDARGVERAQGDYCDIGAVEVLTISGNTTLEGVVLSYVNNGPQTAVSLGDGTYIFSIPYGWSGIVSPSYPGQILAPRFRSYTDVVASQADQDYAPARLLFLPLSIR